MTIFAIIPVHNRIQLTLQFLDSLDAQQVNESVEIIVIDDGSTDGTAQILQQRNGRFPITVLAADGSLWWAGSIKKAISFLLPKVQLQDFVYLANNDTVLDSQHLFFLLQTAVEHPRSLVGSCSQEIWPDESVHTVPGGFRIDVSNLSVTAVDELCSAENDCYDALAGRGLLIPALALSVIRLHPRLMPQHFADLAFTHGLRNAGYNLLIDPRAISMQLDRAGSAVEHSHQPRPSFDKKSALYVPALLAFWWFVSPPRKRPGLRVKIVKRARQVATRDNEKIRPGTSQQS
jgi:GT2 family glycosyltransferase